MRPRVKIWSTWLVVKRLGIKSFKRSVFKLCHLASCLLYVQERLTFQSQTALLQLSHHPETREGLQEARLWPNFDLTQGCLSGFPILSCTSQFHMQGANNGSTLLVGEHMDCGRCFLCTMTRPIKR